MSTIDVQKPTALANTIGAGPRYPVFTKLGQVLAKPSGWVSYTYSRDAADGPFGCGCIDTWAVGRTDLAYRYYMVTGHDHPPSAHEGGIFLAGSNDPESGWTYLNSGNPVIDAADLDSADGDELAAPMAIDYNPWIDKFVIYPHTRGYTGPTGTEQVTVRIITSDMATFTGEGADGAASSVVICGYGDHHGYAYPVRVRGELLLYHRQSGSQGMIEGASLAIDRAGSRFIPLPEYTRPSAIQAVLTNSQDMLLGSHQPFCVAGQWWGLFVVRSSADYASDTRADSIYIAPLADDAYTVTGPMIEVVARGSSGAGDEYSVDTPCVLVQSRAIYIYYCGQSATSNQQRIFVARCRINPDGSYEA